MDDHIYDLSFEKLANMSKSTGGSENELIEKIGPSRENIISDWGDAFVARTNLPNIYALFNANEGYRFLAVGEKAIKTLKKIEEAVSKVVNFSENIDKIICEAMGKKSPGCELTKK